MGRALPLFAYLCEVVEESVHHMIARHRTEPIGNTLNQIIRLRRLVLEQMVEARVGASCVLRRRLDLEPRLVHTAHVELQDLAEDNANSDH